MQKNFLKHKYEKDMSILEKFNDPICKCEFIKYILEHFEFKWKYDAPQICPATVLPHLLEDICGWVE